MIVNTRQYSQMRCKASINDGLTGYPKKKLSKSFKKLLVFDSRKWGFDVEYSELHPSGSIDCCQTSVLLFQPNFSFFWSFVSSWTRIVSHNFHL